MSSGQANSGSFVATSRPALRPVLTPTLPPGESLPVIGRWRLTRLLGIGQWTRVYRACPRESAPDESGDFAVKLLAPEFADDRLARALLRREAQISRLVQHAQLATVLADHSSSDPPHLVLPFLEGLSLRTVIESCGAPQSGLANALPVATALLYVRQAAEALVALHDAGWLHSDVKPENFVVGRSGHATLLDLGLARQLASESCSARFALATTLAYAAPESFSEGEWLSGAADIYSLGIVLWELLTGRPPFVADAVELIDLHRRQAPPDIRTLRPDAPDELAKVVRLMLAKEPLRRPEAPRLVRMLVEREILAMGIRAAA
jgi:eukaryotic-like serine/threonine-protein kinase